MVWLCRWVLGALAAGGVTGASAAERNPVFMYVDEWTPSPQELVNEFVRMATAGVSHIMMAFHLEGNVGFPENIADTVAIWAKLTASERSAAVSKLHELGTKVLISSGGESEGSYWLTQDPVAYATRACTLVKSLGVDGIDFDKEGFAWTTSAVLDWMNKATTTCRQIWPEAIITSAPQSPYMVPLDGVRFSDGLLSGAGQDFYLVQYYNQGTWTLDTTYYGLFLKSGVGSILELYDAYNDTASKNQFVVGKPFLKSHADTGYVEHAALRKMICKAYNELGYRGGFMFWKLPFGQDLSDVTMLAAPCNDATTSSTTTPVVATTTTTTTTTAAVPATTTLATTTTTASTTAAPTTAASTRSTATTISRVSTLSSTAPITSTAASTLTPSTTASTAASTATTTTSATSAVSECMKMITAKPGFLTYAGVCKSYCGDYGPGGQLTAWCQPNQTGVEIAKCVTTQHPFCVIYQ